MSELFQSLQMEILIGLLMLVGYMLSYIYIPARDPRPIRIPHELLVGDVPPDDPFRSPSAMSRRLEDFGRFNTRYNEG